jgi:Ca2+-binding EF-hand superfamily protein
MGATGSFADSDAKLALDGADVDTPRGVSAKTEVRRLRLLLLERSQQTMKLLARARFAELDTDHSGYLENNELVAVVDWVMQSFGHKLGTDAVVIRSKIMARLDANKDGKLDALEFEILFQEMLNRTLLVERARDKFMQFDTNKSGTIESDEIRSVVEWTLQAYPVDNRAAYEERLMANIDANKDGQLDLNEFTDLFDQMLCRIELVEKAKAKFMELDADSSGFLEKNELDHLVSWTLETHLEKTEEQKIKFKSQLLEKIDINKDGKLDLAEFTDLFAEMLDRLELVEEAKRKFRELDADNSGFLEKSELQPIVERWAKANSRSLKMDSDDIAERILGQLDVDKDGKVSLAEFIEGFDNIMYEKKKSVLDPPSVIKDIVSDGKAETV